MYKIFLDKKDNFKCKIELEGASVENASTRLIMENNNQNLIFYGNIDSYGNCNIPVSGIKGILKEHDRGNLKLEVIADDTYFNPWSDEYIIEVSKKVKVEVLNPTNNRIPESHTKIKVTEINTQSEDVYKYLAELLTKNNISRNKILEHKNDILPVIKGYFNRNNIKYNNTNLRDFLKLLK